MFDDFRQSSRLLMLLGSRGDPLDNLLSTIGGVYSRWDFSDNATITQSGGNISAVAGKQDSAGISLVQAGTDAQKPDLITVDSLYQGADFDGTNAFMEAGVVGNYNFLHSGAGQTSFYVIKTDVANPNTQLFIALTSQTSITRGWALNLDDRGGSGFDDNSRCIIGNAAALVIDEHMTNDDAPQQTRLVLAHRYASANATDFQGYVNGVQKASENELATPSTGNHNNVYRLGLYTTGSLGMQGTIHEVIIFNKSLTDAEMALVQSALATKWGIA